MRIMPLLSVPMISTPMMVPTIVPLPPAIAQPPRNAAVIDSSSSPSEPDAGWPDVVRAVSRTAAMPQTKPVSV